jgi:hypothetical protein
VATLFMGAWLLAGLLVIFFSKSIFLLITWRFLLLGYWVVNQKGVNKGRGSFGPFGPCGIFNIMANGGKASKKHS